jgi:membrane fusion protein (multidrug efflux system)
MDTNLQDFRGRAAHDVWPPAPKSRSKPAIGKLPAAANRRKKMQAAEQHESDGQEEDRNEDSQNKDEKPDDKKENSGKSAKKDDKDKDDKKGEDGKDDDNKPQSKWPLIILGIVVVLAIIGGLIYWLMTRGLESTDDAYTEGQAISIAPKVAGYVTELDVSDNTLVKAGDLLLKIDPRDYITARDQALANLALAQAQLSSAQNDLDIARIRAPANYQQAQAQLAQAEANRQQAEQQYRREHGVDPRATTQTDIDQANAQLKSDSAAVSSAEAQVRISSLIQQNIQSAQDTVTQRQAQVEQAKASVAQAEVNLSYTEIRAPQDGRVTRRNVERGTYAQAGQQIFYIVTPQVWVTANFKENQLADMRPGQKVSIAVDSYPKLKLHGHVDSIQAGSGARFTAFPAENATGNYVKIVRRVPVKIVIDSGLDNNNQGLPLGLSVEPTVTVR